MQSMTYGVMPSREDFDQACERIDPDNDCSIDNDGFSFGNDPRVGNCCLSSSELWEELQKAHQEFQLKCNEETGSWISSVLYCLGFEWI